MGGREKLFAYFLFHFYSFFFSVFHLVLFLSMPGNLLFEYVKNPVSVGFHREDLIIWFFLEDRWRTERLS